MKKILLILLLNSCGQQTVDLNELEKFFRGRDVLFTNDHLCEYTLIKTDIGLEIKYKDSNVPSKTYSFSDFEIVEKDVSGIASKVFELDQFTIISQPNRTIMYWYNRNCLELFY